MDIASHCVTSSTAQLPKCIFDTCSMFLRNDGVGIRRETRPAGSRVELRSITIDVAPFSFARPPAVLPRDRLLLYITSFPDSKEDHYIQLPRRLWPRFSDLRYQHSLCAGADVRIHVTMINDTVPVQAQQSRFNRVRGRVDMFPQQQASRPRYCLGCSQHLVCVVSVLPSMLG